MACSCQRVKEVDTLPDGGLQITAAHKVRLVSSRTLAAKGRPAAALKRLAARPPLRQRLLPFSATGGGRMRCSRQYPPCLEKWLGTKHQAIFSLIRCFSEAHVSGKTF